MFMQVHLRKYKGKAYFLISINETSIYTVYIYFFFLSFED